MRLQRTENNQQHFKREQGRRTCFIMTYFKASASKPCGEGYNNVTNSLEICSHLSGNWYMRGGITNW